MGQVFSLGLLLVVNFVSGAVVSYETAVSEAVSSDVCTVVSAAVVSDVSAGESLLPAQPDSIRARHSAVIIDVFIFIWQPPFENAVFNIITFMICNVNYPAEDKVRLY